MRRDEVLGLAEVAREVALEAFRAAGFRVAGFAVLLVERFVVVVRFAAGRELAR